MMNGQMEMLLSIFLINILKSSQKIEEHKKKYVIALSEALKDLEWNYAIPAVMLAGIAYMEF